MARNKNMHKAKKAKNDEFYTQLSDIENELRHYRKHFKGKTVYCNCDDPNISNFFKFFSLNFDKLGLKRLITTCYKSTDANLFSQKKAKKGLLIDFQGASEMYGVPSPEDMEITELKGDGDFRSHESIELLKQADIVVTNPPFSLFREYIDQLMEYDKKFLVVGNNNAIKYKEIFRYIKQARMWLGVNSNKTMTFELPDDYEKWSEIINGVKYGNVPAISWFTNMKHNKQNEELILYKRYNPRDYPKYDNLDAIEVSKVNEIPVDYNGLMGVPITFMSKYNSTQFELVGFRHGSDGKDLTINGRIPYTRLIIKHKR